MADSYSIVEHLSTTTGRGMLSLCIGLATCFLVSIAAMAFVARSIVSRSHRSPTPCKDWSTGDTTVRLDYADRAEAPEVETVAQAASELG
jgi:hypothetical protein